MALHEQCVGATDEWYTPAYVFDALGCRYDMDVAAPVDRQFISTPTCRFLSSDSLEIDWHGFVWMNPPFGKRNGLEPWLDKFCAHGDGIALVPDRTSAPWWQKYAPRSDLALFVGRKIKFIGVDGKPGASPAQGTTLLAMGHKAVAALLRADRAGFGSAFRPANISEVRGANK
jgi:hypothetical protein